MPNSQNSRSNSGNSDSGKGQPRHRTEKALSQKNNPERSDVKHGDHHKDHQGDTGRSSNQGRKSASGGSANE